MFVVYCRYVLESAQMKKFFDYIQLPNFDIAADAAATFKVVGCIRLLTNVHLWSFILPQDDFSPYIQLFL